MPSSALDERFDAAGAKGHRFSPMRVAMAGLLWALIGVGVSSAASTAWVLGVVALEMTLGLIARPLARGVTASRLRARPRARGKCSLWQP